MSAECVAAMKAAGFAVVGTGGNCEAWSRGRVFVSEDLRAPEDFGGECTVWAEDSEGASRGSKCFRTLLEFLELLGREDFDDVEAYIVNGNGEWHVAGQEGKQ